MTIVTGGLLTPVTYGRGFSQVTRPPDPGAGKPVSVVTPGDRDRRVIAVKATLTTSSATGNRTPVLELADGDGAVWARFPAISTVAASGAATVQWAVGVSTAATGITGGDVVGVPPVILTPGHRVILTADGLASGDTITAVAVYAEDLITGPGGYPTGVIPATTVTGPPTL